ncbi:MAG: NAD(P)H-dependent oxidoreductase subunit E [Candidatus Bathyarchaeota archaeon]|nr:NAD(P)H-dependent oxidoreductase subunit E [Candidatus Termitimicrobium sp.]
MPLLQDIQKQCGYLPKEHIIEAAGYLGVPLSRIYAMATYYRSFSLEPRGKYVIKVCDGTACHIKDSKNVLETLKGLLCVGVGGMDKDGLFSVETVNCLGACALAPVMMIGEEYFGKLTEESITEILEGFRKREAVVAGI